VRPEVGVGYARAAVALSREPCFDGFAIWDEVIEASCSVKAGLIDPCLEIYARGGLRSCAFEPLACVPEGPISTREHAAPTAGWATMVMMAEAMVEFWRMVQDAIAVPVAGEHGEDDEDDD
jgi:hypothetical protein